MDEDGLNMTRVFMFLEIKTQYWSTYMQILFKLLQAKPCKSKVISFPFFPFLKSPSGFPTANRKITSGRGSAWRLILIDEFAAIVSAATVIALLLAVGHVRLGTAPSLSLPIPTRWHLLVIRAFTFARRTLQQKRKKKKTAVSPSSNPLLGNFGVPNREAKTLVTAQYEEVGEEVRMSDSPLRCCDSVHLTAMTLHLNL